MNKVVATSIARENKDYIISEMMTNPWGTVGIIVKDSSYVITGDSFDASGINFDKKHVPLNGNNVITFSVDIIKYNTSWDWGDTKAFKVEINNVALLTSRMVDLAAGDRNDPYSKLRAGKISFTIPPDIVAYGEINKLQIIIAQGQNIGFEISQPSLSVAEPLE